jgi:hypothetical protein
LLSRYHVAFVIAGSVADRPVSNSLAFDAPHPDVMTTFGPSGLASSASSMRPGAWSNGMTMIVAPGGMTFP